MSRTEGNASIRANLRVIIVRGERPRATDKQKRQAAHARQQLEPPPMPRALIYLWHWIIGEGIGLIAGVVPAGLGGLAVSWRDVAAWSATMRVELGPWEAGALVLMSNAYLAERYPAPQREAGD